MKAATDPAYAQCPQMVAANNGGDAIISDGADGPVYRFRYGKLASALITLGPFDEALGYLVEKYGKPTSQSTVIAQNAFGAKWELGQGDWQTSDGCVIVAKEEIDTENGFKRSTSVSIFSKEEFQRLKDVQSDRPNPLN